MIQSIHIEKFKSIENQKFDFKPLTILTGTNSSGKSSLIQAILWHSYTYNFKLNRILEGYFDKLKVRKCDVAFGRAFFNESLANAKIKSVKSDTAGVGVGIFEYNLFYLSANRIGPENAVLDNKNMMCGTNGEYIFGFYYYNKDLSLRNKKLVKEGVKNELAVQVNFWLNQILDLNLELFTRNGHGSNDEILIAYKNLDLKNKNQKLLPFNLGAGVSYLAKILILGLSLKKGDIFIVENPEVHLHPKAVSKFAEFFAFLAQGDVQIIIETHSEHIINKMRYLIFKEKLVENNLQIYYREKFDTPFISIRVNKNGKYIDENGDIMDFPAGFFDSDLNELLEMA